MHDDKNLAIWCQQCNSGLLKITHKPFVTLFHKHIFTIPNALCYQCELCQMIEFDESVFETIHQMMTKSMRPKSTHDDLLKSSQSFDSTSNMNPSRMSR